jgi:hypothetical protein
MPTFTVHCNNDKIWNLPELVGFLNQHQHGNITINLNPEAPDLTVVGLYDIMQHFKFKSVEIKTYNPFEHHDVYDITITPGNVFLSHIPSVDHAIQHWNHKKVFLTMFGRPTAGRLAIAACLLQDHAGKSHVHFSSLSDDDNIGLFELEKLAQYDKSMLTPVSKLIQQLPLTIAPTEYTNFTQQNIDLFPNIRDWLDNIINSPLTHCYQDIFVDCVSEGHVQGRTFFPTEKITRPMWCKKPFIVFGSRDYLLYLRQMGFQTFHDFWDEDYDGYEGRDRLNRIIKLIDWIGAQSTQTLENMYQHMQPILEHNFNLLKTQTYTTTIKEVV